MQRRPSIVPPLSPFASFVTYAVLTQPLHSTPISPAQSLYSKTVFHLLKLFWFILCCSQQHLSDVLEDSLFASLYNSMSCWLSVVPSKVIGLHVDPYELNTAVKWWMGLNPHSGKDITQTCPLCSGSMLDPLYHHSGVRGCG